MSTTTTEPVRVLDEEAIGLLFTDAHTANAFAPTEVSDEVLERLHGLTVMAPTAMNTQPLRILWIRSPEAKATVGALMGEGNREKTLAAPLVAVLAFDAAWHEHLETLAPFRAAAKDTFAANEPMRVGMAKTNAAIQMGYFLLAARGLGLDVGPQAGFDAKGVDEAFFTENGWQSFAVVNLGYPAADGAGYRERQARLGFAQQTLTV